MSTENDLKKCRILSKRCCCKYLCLTSLLVGLLGAGLVWFLVPVKFEAQSWLFAYSRFPDAQFGGFGEYEDFLATQFAIIKSNGLLEEALQNPCMDQVKELHKRKDLIRWLQKNVRVSRKGKSEYFVISYRDTVPENAKAVVDAVTEAYLDQYKNDVENREDLLHELTAFEKHIKSQENLIRQWMKEAGQFSEDSANSSLLQEQLQQEAQAVLHKIQERMTKIHREQSSYPLRYGIILVKEAQLPVEPCHSPLLSAILAGIGLFGLILVSECIWRESTIR